MFKLHLTLCFFVALTINTALADSWYKSLSYENYKEERALVMKECVEMNKKVQSGWVEVSDGDKLLYQFYDTYSADKETILFFAGGPGGTGSLFYNYFKKLSEITGMNIVSVDQRGTGCSRPENADDYFDPKYHDPSRIASDAKFVLNSIGVTKPVVVYGKSFGSLPALDFSSRYPESTKRAIIEGLLNNQNIISKAVIDSKAQRILSKLKELEIPLPIGKDDLDRNEKTRGLAMSMNDYGYFKLASRNNKSLLLSEALKVHSHLSQDFFQKSPVVDGTSWMAIYNEYLGHCSNTYPQLTNIVPNENRFSRESILTYFTCGTSSLSEWISYYGSPISTKKFTRLILGHHFEGFEYSFKEGEVLVELEGHYFEPPIWGVDFANRVSSKPIVFLTGELDWVTPSEGVVEFIDSVSNRDVAIKNLVISNLGHSSLRHLISFSRHEESENVNSFIRSLFRTGRVKKGIKFNSVIQGITLEVQHKN